MRKCSGELMSGHEMKWVDARMVEACAHEGGFERRMRCIDGPLRASNGR